MSWSLLLIKQLTDAHLLFASLCLAQRFCPAKAHQKRKTGYWRDASSPPPPFLSLSSPAPQPPYPDLLNTSPIVTCYMLDSRGLKWQTTAHKEVVRERIYIIQNTLEKGLYCKWFNSYSERVSSSSAVANSKWCNSRKNLVASNRMIICSLFACLTYC